MSERKLSVLGLPYLYTYKFYYRAMLRRRKWSELRLEHWLERHGLQVTDGGMDEHGEYFVVGTYDGELAEAIQAQIDTSLSDS